MALLIKSNCINCDMCLPECPNNAIVFKNSTYTIEPSLCTECVGFYDSPACISACPIDCITPNPKYIETQEELLQKYKLNLN